MTNENTTAGTTEIETVKNSGKKTFLQDITEDWWAVFIGGVIILAALAIALSANDFKFPLPVYQWATTDELFNKVFSAQNLLLIAEIGLLFYALSSIAVVLSGGNAKKYLAGFVIIYILAFLSLIFAGNKLVSFYGLEYVVFALVIGLMISNLGKLPSWIKEAARSEFFIKTGLIILGTSILFTDIVKAGLPGMLQAIFVVSAVWFFALWLSRKFKVDDEFGVMLASAVAICGVSAAIVACGAIKGDKKKLSYVTTLVLVVAIPMLIFQPWIIKAAHIPEIVGGAWLGGTLDTTASVTAAAQLVGNTALKAGVIIKFSQNVLIGLAAFLITIWWAYRKVKTVSTDKTASTEKINNEEKPGLSVVWERFPKFVLGFIAASLIFSFWVPADTVKNVSGILNSLRTMWFALAFLAIGLEAKFTDLIKIEGGRPALTFIVAQLFNILWTLLCAYLLFGGILLPIPDIK